MINFRFWIFHFQAFYGLFRFRFALELDTNLHATKHFMKDYFKLDIIFFGFRIATNTFHLLNWRKPFQIHKLV